MSRTVIALTAALTLAAGASAASASTYFVSPTGNNANNCTSSSTPCLTIAGAIAKARAGSDAATINVAAGTYAEDVALNTAADGGTAIVGAGSGAGGTVIQGVNGNPAVTLGSSSSSNALSHLKVINSPGGGDDGVDASTTATLTDVAIEMQHAGSGDGLTSQYEPVVFDSGSVTMAAGTTGTGLVGSIGGLTVHGSTVTLVGSASGSAIVGSLGTLTISNTIVAVGTGAGSAIAATVSHLTVKDSTLTDAGASSSGIVSSIGQLTLQNVSVAMSNAANNGVAVENVQGTSTEDNLAVSGSWVGIAFITIGNTVLRDSHLTSTASGTPVTEFIDGGSAGRSMLVQRSVVRQTNAGGVGVIAVDADLTFDSSEILGGQYGLETVHSSGKTRTLTLAGSTIDAGTLGTRDALPGFSAINAIVSGSNNSTLDVLVQGSIVADPQTASISGSNSVTIACNDSDVPDQTQAATASQGAINCAKGASGNTQTDPLTSLVANPTAATPDYTPVAGGPAIDAVPDSGISLPAGVTASATDFAGNARVVDGNADCAAQRDKGALELQGHAGTVPAPAISAPATGVAGTPVAFTGSAPNVPAGTSVSFSWSFSGGGTASGATASHAFAAPGAATATLTASSGGSCSASTAANLTIAPALAIDAITNLKVTPSVFAAASSGASIAAKKGATVRYVGSQPATTAFGVQRRKVGRRVGKKCVKATKGNIHKKPCARYVTVGSFSHTDAAAGAVTFRFTGRVGGHRLPHGSYRLRAVPTNAAGTGKPATASFRIKA